MMSIDYTKPSSIARVLWYRSEDPDLPLESWEMVADRSIFATNYVDDRAHKTGRTHYLTCRYVFIDGELSGFADITAFHPVTKPEDIVMKQNRDLN